ncbi:MFS transporter, partial [Tepidimonas fonticaldi]|uniref:MFS transporter n=1 Tax=Tepidimonas fonticaldi TaxID=1101373 RepID=UPI0022B2458A
LGTALTGLFSVVAQVLIPLAASIAKPHKRGKAVGMIMSGLLLGILLARTVSGAVAMVGGWRAIYWVAFALLMLLMIVLAIKLPRYHQKANLNYFKLIGSIGRLLCGTPVLAVRASLGALSFAKFWFTVDRNGFLISQSDIQLFRRDYRFIWLSRCRMFF